MIYCDNDSINLFLAPSGFASYYWNTGESNQYIASGDPLVLKDLSYRILKLDRHQAGLRPLMLRMEGFLQALILEALAFQYLLIQTVYNQR